MIVCIECWKENHGTDMLFPFICAFVDVASAYMGNAELKILNIMAFVQRNICFVLETLISFWWMWVIFLVCVAGNDSPIFCLQLAIYRLLERQYLWKLQIKSFDLVLSTPCKLWPAIKLPFGFIFCPPFVRAQGLKERNNYFYHLTGGPRACLCS